MPEIILLKLACDGQGKNIVYRAGSGIIVLLKCLELALNSGIDKFTGKQLGVRTPDPLTFTSVENIMEAFIEQVRFFVWHLTTIANTLDVLYEEYIPRPFLSAFLDDCIPKAKDCRRWSYFPKALIFPIGAINVADSFAAMKKLVFEEKRVTMKELLDALKNNW